MDRSETPTESPKRFRRLPLLVGALWLGLFVALFASGVSRDVSVDELVERVHDAGPWGALAYLGAFSVLQPLGITSHVFAIGAALVWPPGLAIVLALIGANGAAATSFLLARFVLFDWVRARLSPRVLALEGRFIARGLRGLVMLRLLSFTTQPVNWLLGTTAVPFRASVVSGLIGFIPVITFDVVFGGEFFRWLFG
ncbi:MAG: VTT domain-containing protein [Myxococcota bacterium]